MYITMNYNMYIICIRNTARSKSIPLMCTYVYSYIFSTMFPPEGIVTNFEAVRSTRTHNQSIS